MTYYLDYIIYGIIYFIAALILIIIYYHIRAERRNNFFLKKKKIWELTLLKYLNDEIEIDRAVELFSDDYMYLYRFFKPYLINIEGDDYKKLVKLINRINMDDFFLKKLEKGYKNEKIKAAVFLGKIKEKKALPLLEKELESDNKYLMLASVRAIAEIGELNLFFPVLKTVLKKTSMTFEALTEVSIKFGRKVCFTINDISKKRNNGEIDLQDFFSVPEYQVLSLFFDIFGYFRFVEGIEAMKKLLEEDINDEDINDEIIIHIFKALIKIEYPIEIDMTSFLKHENWVIRSQTARFLGVVKDKKYINLLVDLMEDPNWWVRYYSGLSLYKMGKEKLLEEIIENNRKGKDMSKYILEKNKLLSELVGDYNG